MNEPLNSPAPASAAPPTLDAVATPVRRRRLPAFVRYALAALLGVAAAGLASYLMRSIGF
jgi:hypothetical protein